MKHILFILFFSTFCIAENSAITVDGLTFKCEGCEQVDDDYCSIPWGSKKLNVLCDSVVNILIQKVKKGDSYPTTDELISYLSRSDINLYFKKIAYRLVLDRKMESGKLEALITLLTTRDYNIVPYIIDLKFEYFNEMLWDRRKLLSKDDYFKLIDLKGGLSALFDDLTVVDLEQDILILDSYHEHLKAIDPNTVEAKKISTFLKECKNTFKCELRNIESNGLKLNSYVYRVQNSIISNYVLNKKEKKLGDLDLLINTRYENYRTPETHLALLSVIENKDVKANIKKEWDSLEAPMQDFLGFMASKDSRIAKLVYEKEKKGFSLDTFNFNSSNLNSWIFFLLSSLILSSIFFLLYSGKKIKVVNRVTKRENNELKNELSELSQIWSFFGLSQGANLVDLKKRYRQMARENHPDVGNAKDSSAEDFMLINKYYKRALELMGEA